MWLKLADWDEGYWDVGSRAGELKLRILWPLHVESKKDYLVVIYFSILEW